MGGPTAASEAEKEDSDGEEVEPPRMYEILLQNGTYREGISAGLPVGSRRGGWGNVMVRRSITGLAFISETP